MQECITQLRCRSSLLNSDAGELHPAKEKNTQQEKIYTRMNIVYIVMLTQ